MIIVRSGASLSFSLEAIRSPSTAGVLPRIISDWWSFVPGGQDAAHGGPLAVQKGPVTRAFLPSRLWGPIDGWACHRRLRFGERRRFPVRALRWSRSSRSCGRPASDKSRNRSLKSGLMSIATSNDGNLLDHLPGGCETSFRPHSVPELKIETVVGIRQPDQPGHHNSFL